MNSFREYAQLQDDLSSYIESIQKEISLLGYQIPKSELIGYLIENQVEKIDTDIEENFGSTKEIVEDLIKSTNVAWPVDPWHDGSIEFKLEKTDVNLNQTTSSSIMKSITYFHYATLIPTLYVIIIVFLTFSYALILAEPSSFRLFAEIRIFVWYPISLFPIYYATSKISSNRQLRTGVDDMDQWLRRIKLTSLFHLTGLVAFSMYILIGSIAQIKITGVNEIQKEANNIKIEDSVLLIINSSFFVYQGFKQLWSNSHGSILKIKSLDFHNRYYYWSTTVLGIILKIYQVILLNAIIELFEGYRRVEKRNYNVIRGLDEIIILVNFAYFIIILLFYLLFRFSNTSDIKNDTITNHIKSSIMNLLAMVVFLGLYVMMKFEAISNLDPNLSIIEKFQESDSIFPTFIIISFQIIMIYILSMLRVEESYEIESI